MRKFICTVFLFLFILVVMGIGNSVKAEEALSISNWRVDAGVLETGDLSVTEDITFQFNDEFNGVFREIVLDKTSGVANIRVKEILGNTGLEYKLVKEADHGDQGVFVVEETSDKVLIQIFSPSEDQEKTFQISYIVKNVAIKYQDIGELYYKFLGSENETPIDNFTVNIRLPKSITENTKIFAHGPLTGEMGSTEDTFFLRVKDVPTETFVEARVLFPREYIPLSTRIINIDNFENIVKEEASLQENIEQDRQKTEGIKTVLEQISIIASTLGFGLFILSLIAFRRKRNSLETEEYSRIPEDCTPAVAASLTGTPISSNTIIATMLDLFRKGYLKVDHEEFGRKKSTDKDIVITKVKEENDSLFSHEKHFIKWFVHDIGNGKSVTTQSVEDYSKENSTEFLKSYSQWQKKIKEDAISKGYYDKTKGKYGTIFIILSLIFLVIGIFDTVYGGVVGIASILVSILLFINALTLYYRRSEYGNDQYIRWIGFRKYIKEFKSHSTIDDFSKYPHDSSLIYALSLGVNMKIADKYEFNRENSTDQIYANNSWIYWYIILNSGKDNAFDRSIHNSVGGSTDGSIGGGFSSGGGGGAGGGGAGGF